MFEIFQNETLEGKQDLEQQDEPDEGELMNGQTVGRSL